MSDLRLDLLEKKVEVMQQEFSQVLGELQVTIQGLAKMTQIGLHTLVERVNQLETSGKLVQEEIQERKEGKEL